MKTTATAIAAAALVTVGSVGATVTPSSAATGGTQSPPAAAGTRMMLVLDSSGSMKEAAGGGQTRIEAAKQALTTVVDSLPDEQSVGLRVYGATVFSRDDAGACEDSQRVVDLGTDNRDELRGAIDGYRPYGETPTGYALQQAGRDLGGEGQRTIVLVSDGEPTCDPDPCAVAKDLSKDGIDLRIDVVGLDVSGKARETLRCVADAGNGTYYDADDADSITDSLVVSSTRASRPFDLTGTPVQGDADVATAPRIGTGQYLDRIPASGPISYRVQRTVPGSTIHLGVTLKGVAGSAGNGVRVDMTPADDDAGTARCGSASGFGNGVGTRDPLLYGSASTWKADPDSACNTASEIVATLAPTVGGAELAGQPIEIAVYEEPPLADPSGRGLAPAPSQPRWSPLTPGSPTTVVPGTSLANAPVVSDGTYAGDINPGESQVLAIPVDWGQDVQAQLDAQLTREVIEAGGAGSDIEVNVIGPVREENHVSFGASEPSDWTQGALANLRGEPAFRTGAQTQTVTYLNRGSNSTQVRGAAVPGLRYVQVTYNVRGDEANLPYTLTLKTNGTAGQGAPEYADGDLQEPAADSRLTVAADPDVPEEDAGDAADTGDDRAAAGDGDDGPPLVPLGLGALGVAALVAAGVVIARARRA